MRAVFRLILVLFVLGAVTLGYSFACYYRPSAIKDTTVVIPSGSGLRGTLALLHEAEVLPSTELILAPLLLTSDPRMLKAGEYAFYQGMTPADIIAKLVRGEVVVHKLTIPEGWTSYQVRAALMAEPLLTGDIPATIAEGSLLPDTIHFARGESRASIVARMQEAQQKLLAQLWPRRVSGLPYATPEEALVMASIVERETGKEDERALVAGVFVNRLRAGMLLQTDPSVIYGLEREQGGKPMERALTTADLKRDTPYNTYMRGGLPPEPICHPGRKAIEAALNPAASNALYFVATGNGGHRFAATLQEHNANVAAYRRELAVQATRQ